jgi:hypothetical protein
VIESVMSGKEVLKMDVYAVARSWICVIAEG